VSAFERLFGVDFSGGAAAHRAIWIAEGVRDRDRVKVLRLERAAERFGVRSGAAAHEALAAFIGETTGALFAIDVPFSLPAPLMTADWPSFARTYADRFADADAMRAWATGEAEALAGRKELKRACDAEAKTPFAAYNLRLYRQTDAAIRRLAAPLMGRAAFPPMEAGPAGAPAVIEACPASALKARDAYRPYKGRGAEMRARRAEIAAGLAERLDLAGGIAEAAEADVGGDALDALLCLEIAARADPSDFTPRSEAERLEGRVWF